MMSSLSFNRKLNFLSYNSSSISSSSSASFHPNTNDYNSISSSKSATTPGFLAAILRRILCSNSLPSHQITIDTDTQVCFISYEKDQELKSEDKVMPSLVARLMGLEGVPNASASKISTGQPTNSLDFDASIAQMEGDNSKHRRVQSSTCKFSIQEMPTFFEVENEEFFVLSFGNGNEDKEKEKRRKKREMGPGELKQSRGERYRNKNQQVSSKPENPCNTSEIMEFSTVICSRRNKKKKKRVRSIELECSSEDSSPVSVLDFDQFIMSELDHSKCQSPRNNNNTKKSEGKYVGSRKRYIHSHHYINICNQICKMTDGEVAESNWLHKKNTLRHEDFEAISADLGSEILDQSVQELVHQLIGLAM